MGDRDADFGGGGFEPSGEPLAVFRREAGSKAVGCLVYVAITPFIALFLALVPSYPLSFAFRQLGMSEESANGVFPILLIPSFLGTIAWGIREYRGRALVEVGIYRDGVVALIGGSRKALAWVDVEAVRLAPFRLDLACILVPKAGRPFRLPPEIAPCSVVAGALEATVVRGLARQLGRRIDDGGSFEVQEVGGTSAFIVGRGLIVIAGAVLMVLSLRYARWGSISLRHGALLVRQGLDGSKGGFVADAEGVRSLNEKSPDPIPWSRMAVIQADLSGIAFRSNDGRSIVASPFAEGFWPAAAWISSRITT